MKIIISPAKKMKEDHSWLFPQQKPVYEKEAGILLKQLLQYSVEELQVLMKANESICRLNYERFRRLDFTGIGTPAILAYEGLQYQHIGADVLEQDQLSYLEDHLRILSGFYGILRPLDEVWPYRLEMQTRLSVGKKKNLYDFWGEKIYRELIKEDHIIINLASKEYSKAVERYLTPDDCFITCIFGELVDGRVKVKGTKAKEARGDMVRYLAERKVEEPEKIKEFDNGHFCYEEALSGERNYVFLRYGSQNGKNSV
ncbi:hypothetical protein BHF69_06025 [Anaerostipes sp. 992a]|uniref:peroxide stress protein YaaA n=1 Tax=Anaerostipes sp. 992a TaxID=1261637 RepID=UPI0009522D8A|nr:peroxide stress protein YaaA [Anaerostipes sp. 992a]OLR62270.1 hypothetical protein BHF69_06025 [Anaerostipes sp. 992a]